MKLVTCLGQYYENKSLNRTNSTRSEGRANLDMFSVCAGNVPAFTTTSLPCSLPAILLGLDQTKYSGKSVLSIFPVLVKGGNFVWYLKQETVVAYKYYGKNGEFWKMTKTSQASFEIIATCSVVASVTIQGLS